MLLAQHPLSGLHHSHVQEQGIQALQQWLTLGPGSPLMTRLDVQILIEALTLRHGPFPRRAAFEMQGVFAALDFCLYPMHW